MCVGFIADFNTETGGSERDCAELEHLLTFVLNGSTPNNVQLVALLFLVSQTTIFTKLSI